MGPYKWTYISDSRILDPYTWAYISESRILKWALLTRSNSSNIEPISLSLFPHVFCKAAFTSSCHARTQLLIENSPITCFVPRAVGLLALIGSTQAQLQLGFYAKSCPNAEKIVLDFVHQHIHNAPSLAATFIRMHFHDCFVRGCDGSVLINSTSNNQAEKDSQPNQTLRGFDFIDRVKSLLEAECPGVVSCADVLSLVARDTIVATGGPYWEVPTGRRDGVISRSSEALNNIPPPFGNFSTLQRLFANQGLDLKDLVLLSGAHTIGIAHCSSFRNRLYNFTGVGDQDPSLDPRYAANLKANKCKTPTDNSKVEMDPGSRNTFDLSYYSLLLKRRGLFESDAALTTDATTLGLVQKLVQGPIEEFFAEFAASMEKMGRIKVKTGTEGEIRRRCAVVNS